MWTSPSAVNHASKLYANPDTTPRPHPEELTLAQFQRQYDLKTAQPVGENE